MAVARLVALALLATLCFTQVTSQPFGNPDPKVNCPAGYDNSRQWTYGTGSALWGSLCQHYGVCTNGKKQSPINIVESPQAGLTTLNLQYERTDVQYVRVGPLVSLATNGNNVLNYANKQWNLRSVELKSPSEHTFNGVPSPFELQLFHENIDAVNGRRYAAVSILFDQDPTDADNAFITELFCNLPRYTRCQCGDNRTHSFAPFNEVCDNGPQNGDAANSCRGSCIFPTCGDGIVDRALGEVCDNGPLNSDVTPGACRRNCTLPRCGDNVVDPGEQCDPGWQIQQSNTPVFNISRRTHCDAKCRFQCGNGRVDSHYLDPLREECDNGAANNDARINTTGTQLCRTDCELSGCGDGITDIGEECDDDTINATIGARCRPNCKFSVCGDGIVDFARGEACDGGPLCNSTCGLLCGNGVVDSGEQCDLGNANNNTRPNTCRTNCRNPTCGDGVVDAGEQCDDGVIPPALIAQFNGTRRCFVNCTFRCGNQIINEFEQCDNGDASLRPNDGNNNTRPNACRQDCTLFKCGDGILDPLTEFCDNGPLNSNTVPNACRLNCSVASCGDNVLDQGEECDDGNRRDLDGCNSCCKKECGDGIWNTNSEQCDDGSLNSDSIRDRCRRDCTIHHCGDGVVDSDEECDPASPLNPQGCRANCRLPFCGDGIRDAILGEECDNGAANSYSDVSLTGCSPICTVNRCGRNVPVFPPQSLNLQSLIPINTLRAYTYEGSWTHPPCTENVQWFVSQTRLRISLGQLRRFRELYGMNARAVQNRDSNPLTQVISGPPTTSGAVCGNGIKEVTEICDNGPDNSDTEPNACRKNCRPSRCGDGVRDQGEDCDGESYCSQFCQLNWYVPPNTTSIYRCHEWTYEGQGAWSHLKGPGRCDQCCGENQSPINLPAACPANGRPLDLNNPAHFNYNPSPLVFFNTGNDIIWPTAGRGTFSYGGITYTLEEVTFHEPSLHTIDGKRFDFEAVLYHAAQNPGVNQRAAVSVLFQKSEQKNDFLDRILNLLPAASECVCGNGIKEDRFHLPDGTVRREECDDGERNSDSVPDRCRTDCRLARCGDGVADKNEACDQGARNGRLPNRCRPDCTLPVCGDGVFDSNTEQCDDGNNFDLDGCSSTCRSECGDGNRAGTEQCDNGVLNSNTAADACRVNCQLPKCGDGVQDRNEECDSGAFNANTSNACRLSCRLPRCGDNITDPLNFENCDGGAGCGADCRLLCGNGRLDAGEQCDDGVANSNTVPGACRTNCRAPTCGDNVRDYGEECDGPAPFCVGCKVVCGNGFLEQIEQCDWGVLNSNTRPNSCRVNCQLPKCGDGVVDNAGLCFEECDNGPANNDFLPGACRTNCRNPSCGDFVVDISLGEQCDDGNKIDGDGCTSGCTKECGNGLINAREQCDAGDKNSNILPSCCRADCTLPKCGDGVTDFGEECDDGPLNREEGNYCHKNCTVPYCGDGYVDWQLGELCDLGTKNSDTSIDGCSRSCTPNSCGQSVNLNLTANPEDLLPEVPGVYHYSGSIARPPCTENTLWWVFSNPVTISGCQIEQFQRILDHNIRGVQPLNGRQVRWLSQDSKCCDGIVEGNEECDDGENNSDFLPNRCRRNCKRPRCGDGIVDLLEQCDGTPNCDSNCRVACPSSSPSCSSNSSSSSSNNLSSGSSGDSTLINVNFANLLA